MKRLRKTVDSVGWYVLGAAVGALLALPRLLLMGS